MSNNKIQQSLIEIEENLRHLDSARNQVLSIADSSHKLTDKVLFLVNNFQELNASLSEENNTIIDQLNRHNNSFKERVNKVTDNIDSSVDSLIEKINSSSNKFSINLEDVSQKYISNSEKLINEKSEVLDSIVEKQLGLSKSIKKVKNQLEVLDFHKITNEILNQLEAQEKVAKAINQELTQTKNALLESEQKITKLINEDSVSKARKLDGINETIAKSKKNQSMFFVTIIGLVFMVLAVLILR